MPIDNSSVRASLVDTIRDKAETDSESATFIERYDARQAAKERPGAPDEIERRLDELRTKNDKDGEQDDKSGTKSVRASIIDAAAENLEAQTDVDTDADDTDVDEQSQDNTGTDKAPDILPKDLREDWAKIPPNSKNYIRKTAKELNDAKAELGRTRTKYKDLDDTLQPYQTQMAAIGASEAVVIKSLMSISDGLSSNDENIKYQTFANLADRFGIDLGQAAQQAEDYNQLPAEIRATLEQARQAKQENEQLVAHITEQRRVAGAAAKTTIDKWKTDKPHFKSVKDAMHALMRSGAVTPPKDHSDAETKAWIDRAYRAACRVKNLDIEPTKVASSKNIKQPKTPTKSTPNTSMRDSLRSAIREHKANASR